MVSRKRENFAHLKEFIASGAENKLKKKSKDEVARQDKILSKTSN